MKKIVLLLEWTTDANSEQHQTLERLLADTGIVLDHAEDALIVADENDAVTVGDMLDEAHIPYETMELLPLAQGAKLYASFSDFGLTTAVGHAYVFADLAVVFSLEPNNAQSDERSMAGQQLDEHIIATFVQEQNVWYAIERHLLPLAAGIARAYDCTIVTAAP